MSEADEFGLYVHWPYCARICPYCDFNVYKNKTIDALQWMHAFTSEIAYWAERLPGRKLTSIYFGGGTPSLAPLELIAGVIEACQQSWETEKDIEITLEANPNCADQSAFDQLRRIGINRLSLGVQSFDDAALKFLGRDHSGQDAKRAIEMAQGVFDRVTFDLIYALPDQTLAAWETELRQAMQFNPGHLSLYELTIEQGTAFAHAVSAGRWAPLGDDSRSEMFELARTVTSHAGLVAYEISNFAKTGHQSRHNLTYWRYRDYLGIGPGAHGRVTVDGVKHATKVFDQPNSYFNAVAVTGVGTEDYDALSPEEVLIERLSMGLRIAEGVPLYADDVFYRDETRVSRFDRLISEGMLTNNCGTVRTTPAGARLLNAVLAELFT